MEFLHFFSFKQSIPDGYCSLWQPGLGSLDRIADLLIALAYYSIPLIVVYFFRAKQDTLFNRMFLMFGTFVVACGTTHVMEVWTLWHPVNRISELVKAITALVCVLTAIKLISLLPKVLTLPSPNQPETANTAQLAEETEAKSDITEQQHILDARQKQIEQEQLVAQLEQLNALKDNFLNTVSHELRTPLCNIMMAVQILQSISTDEQTQRYLEILQVECDRELELINDLLDLQRVEAATAPLVTPEPLLLEYWLHNITESFVIRTQERQQTLLLDLPSGIPPLVSDHTSLARIFIELLNNACKYTPVGGKIILRVCHEKSGVWAIDENSEKQGNVRLTRPHEATYLKSASSVTALAHARCDNGGDPTVVASSEGTLTPDFYEEKLCSRTRSASRWIDKHFLQESVQRSLTPNEQTPSSSASCTIFTISNSAEIPEAALPRIFDKFYRVSKPEDYKQNGSGLGLALVQKLVEQLQGTIQVESSAGWTTFTLKFRDLALGT